MQNFRDFERPQMAAQLADMGFSADEAQAALAACGDSVERALELLLGGGGGGGDRPQDGAQAAGGFGADSTVLCELSQYSFPEGRSACSCISATAAQALLEAEAQRQRGDEAAADATPATLAQILTTGVDRYSRDLAGVEHQSAAEVLLMSAELSAALEVKGGPLQRMLTDRDSISEVLAEAQARGGGAPVGVIFTKPPETVLVVLPGAEGRPLMVFDSHSRPELGMPGASLSSFSSAAGVAERLRLLFPAVEGLGGGIMAETYNCFEATVVASASLSSPSSSASSSSPSSSSGEAGAQQ